MQSELGQGALEAQILVRYLIFFFTVFGLILFGYVAGYWSRQGRSRAKDELTLLEKVLTENMRLKLQRMPPTAATQAPPQRVRRTYPPATFYSAHSRDATAEIRALPQYPDSGGPGRPALANR